MKVTKSYLQQVIKEELENLKEFEPVGGSRAGGPGDMSPYIGAAMMAGLAYLLKDTDAAQALMKLPADTLHWVGSHASSLVNDALAAGRQAVLSIGYGVQEEGSEAAPTANQPLPAGAKQAMMNAAKRVKGAKGGVKAPSPKTAV